ncbi:MAG TPA: arginyltransferase [Paracoccaceae bacterium]|nr:arginyltransferase [Paracoccaceae bacterium]
MRYSLPVAPQFYVTAPQPCPYLDGQKERKLFTAAVGENASALNNALSRQGFRRSQNVIYRPACSHCSACMSARIVATEFSPSRSQRRNLKANSNLRRETRAPWATDEQFELFQKYLQDRHADGGMAGMDSFEFSAMVEETPVTSRIIEYWDRVDGQNILVAVALTDVLKDGLSMVYSFFDPDLADRGLGTYMIQDHVAIAREAGLPYVYLGFWVPGSPKMDYKSRFSPLEIYRKNEWLLLEDTTAYGSADHPLAADPIFEQVAAIQLPELAKSEL